MRPAKTFVGNRALLLTDISAPMSEGGFHYDGPDAIMDELIPLINSDIDYDAGEEMVDWISTRREVVASLPRSLIHKFNLLHRGVGALILDSERARILVHRRSKGKRIFPGLWDMFVGGVSAAGEAPAATLFREMMEETNLDLRAQGVVWHIGACTVETSYNHCDVDVYIAECSKEQEQDIRFPDGEIETAVWMTLEQLRLFIDQSESELVPDGMQVWRAVPQLLDRIYK